MKIELNEPALLKSYLEGDLKNDNKTKISNLLSKHCYTLGMNKEQTKVYIIDLLQKNMKYFVLTKFEKLLDEIIENQYKYENKIINVDKIHITNKELESISWLKNKKLEQLAFSYLVYAKVFNKVRKNNNNWVNIKQSDIFKDAKVVKTVKEQNFMIAELIELGVLKDALRNNNLSKQVQIVDNDESEPEIVIDKFKDEDNFVYHYLKWKGEKIINCSECGTLIKQKSNRQTMCKKCWGEKEKEDNRRYAKESMRKKRRC